MKMTLIIRKGTLLLKKEGFWRINIKDKTL